MCKGLRAHGGRVDEFLTVSKAQHHLRTRHAAVQITSPACQPAHIRRTAQHISIKQFDKITIIETAVPRTELGRCHKSLCYFQRARPLEGDLARPVLMPYHIRLTAQSRLIEPKNLRGFFGEIGRHQTIAHQQIIAAQPDHTVRCQAGAGQNIRP